MLKLRLNRIGRKGSPFYRIVIMNDKTSLTGRTIAVVGYYNPMTKGLFVNYQQTIKWLFVGAQPTKTVSFLLRKFSTIETKIKD